MAKTAAIIITGIAIALLVIYGADVAAGVAALVAGRAPAWREGRRSDRRDRCAGAAGRSGNCLALSRPGTG